MMYLAWFLANAVWFGFFMYLVAVEDYTLWVLAIPIILHWSIKDIT